MVPPRCVSSLSHLEGQALRERERENERERERERERGCVCERERASEMQEVALSEKLLALPPVIEGYTLGIGFFLELLALSLAGLRIRYQASIVCYFLTNQN